jgi:hypothetical protein
MEETDAGTRVRVETDMRVTGPAAQFGRGVMQDVSAKLMGRFADCLAQEMAAEPAEPAATTAGSGARAPAAEPPPGPAGDSAEAAARGESAAGPARPTEAVLDLGEVSRDAVLKRVAPAVAAIAGLVALLALRRRRR